jgi:hypothetical protein
VYLLQTLGLFVLTALAEIVGCYLPYLWLKKDGPADALGSRRHRTLPGRHGHDHARRSPSPG